MANSRTNDSNEATIERDTIYSSGTFKNVWKGIYVGGARNGQQCVAKEFKTGSVFEASYFAEEMRLIRITQTIIDDFDINRILGPGRQILLNTPAIWVYTDGTGRRALVEPMIKNFEKFNSNTGWASVSGSEWSDAMQALSHFSYHNSNRQILLCDLQGGVYSNGYVLSDPVIMSQTQDHGPADLGADGINSFFQRHRCGRFCSRHWMRPAVIGPAVFPMVQGTFMTTARLPTRLDRDALTRLRGPFT